LKGNVAPTNDRFGNAAEGCGFDGAGDYILIPASATLKVSDAFSFASWIFLENSGSNHTLAVQGTSFDTTGNWEIYVGGDGNLRLHKNNVNNSQSDGTVRFYAWHHVAVTFQSGTTRFYIDGNLDSTKSQGSATFRSTTDGIKIGEREYSSGGGDLSGKMDEIRIYRRTLSDSEIGEIFRSGNVGPYNIDSDRDGLTDELEERICSNPLDFDSDGDGVRDGAEDADHDGFLGIEDNETHPCRSDTDGDGFEDGFERTMGTSAIDGDVFPLVVCVGRCDGDCGDCPVDMSSCLQLVFENGRRNYLKVRDEIVYDATVNISDGLLIGIESGKVVLK
jgi:hypothetical protein